MHRVEALVDAHIVRVDLACGGVEVVATPPESRRSTVSDFARWQGADIAVNANLFEVAPCGLAVGEGRVWRDSRPGRCTASAAFGLSRGAARGVVFDSEMHPHDNPFPWARAIVSGAPMLMMGGEVFDRYVDPEMFRPHPRTVLGLSTWGQTLVLAVIDGRRMETGGLSAPWIVALMEEFGAADVLNLDGGGSSTLFIGREGGVVNRPSEGEERVVMNHLGVRIAGTTGE